MTGKAPGGGAGRRWVVIGAAEIRDYALARSYLREGDFCVYCDGGLRHRHELGARPGLIVGDFDSSPRPDGPEETIVLPREKDDTDTMFAAREGVRRGASEFLLLGCAGGRLDHTLGNLAVLFWLDGQGKRALLADDLSELEVVSRLPAEVGPEWPCFSLLSLDGPARGIAVAGAKYPLDGAEMGCEHAYGVSNEPLPGRTARIAVGEGRLLLIRVRRP